MYTRDITTTRRNELTDYLNSIQKGEKFYVKDLAEMLGVSGSTIVHDLKLMADKIDGTITPCGQNRNAGFMMLDKKVDKDDFISNKNPEGYLDLTAAKAIRNVEPPKGTKKMLIPAPKIEIGQVWSSPCPDGSSEYMLIIRRFDDFSEYLKLIERSECYEPAVKEVPFTVLFQFRGKTYSTDIRRINTKPNRYIKQKLFTIESDKFQNIMDGLAEIFGPCKAVQEAPDAMELALLKQKVEIYERLIFERKIPL